MSTRSLRAAKAALAVFAVLGAAASAHAALGGAPMPLPAGATASPVAPRAVAAAAASAAAPATASAAGAAYTVTQTNLASGTSVREYVAQGTVFGIAWNGPRMPDLQSLLGNYFPQYVKGIDAQRAQGVRGAVNLQTTGLAVQSGGHMGSFFGRAWLPQGLPSGVTADDIR
jgi:hypothetical protein